MAERRCVLNSCKRTQGIGTWCHIEGFGNQPVCEEHWQALRNVPYLPIAPLTAPSGPVNAQTAANEGDGGAT